MEALLCVVLALLVQPGEDPTARRGTPAALSLRDAVAEALRASPLLLPAQDAVAGAGIQQRLAESQFGLRLTPDVVLGGEPGGVRQQQAGVTATRRLLSGTELSASASWIQFGERGAEVRDGGYSFTITQPLVQAFGPGPRAGLVNARRAVASAERAVLDTRQLLVVRTAEAYFAIVRQQLLHEAAGYAFERANRLRAASEARARVGLATELDVMRAELLASQAEVAVQGQQASLERARDALKLLLGRPLDEPIQVEAGELADARTITAVPDDLADAARARRIDLQEARDRATDARRAEEIARWALLPDVQLTASYTRRGLGDRAGALFNEMLGGWRVGLRTGYALDRGSRSAVAATASLSAGAAERAAADLEQAIVLEVREAGRAVARTRQAIAIHQKAVDVAQRQTRLAQLRYERGLADNVDLIDAESSLLNARSALIGAQVDHAMARLALDRATGRLNPDEYLR
jgi:outer membrane protein TolC